MYLKYEHSLQFDVAETATKSDVSFSACLLSIVQALEYETDKVPVFTQPHFAGGGRYQTSKRASKKRLGCDNCWE